MIAVAVGSKTYFDIRERQRENEWRKKNAKHRRVPINPQVPPSKGPDEESNWLRLESMKNYIAEFANYYIAGEEEGQVEDIEKETSRVKINRLYERLLKILPARNLTSPTPIPVSFIHHQIRTRFNTRKLSSVVFPFHSEAEETVYEKTRRNQKSSSSLETGPALTPRKNIVNAQSAPRGPETVVQVVNNSQAKLDKIDILKLKKMGPSNSISITPSMVSGMGTDSRIDGKMRWSNAKKPLLKKRVYSKQGSRQSSVME